MEVDRLYPYRQGYAARQLLTLHRYGNSTRCFAKMDRHTVQRMALLLSKRHGRRGRGHGMKHVIMSGNRLGLLRLVGSVRFERSENRR